MAMEMSTASCRHAGEQTEHSFIGVVDAVGAALGKQMLHVHTGCAIIDATVPGRGRDRMMDLAMSRGRCLTSTICKTSTTAHLAVRCSLPNVPRMLLNGSTTPRLASECRWYSGRWDSHETYNVPVRDRSNDWEAHKLSDVIVFPHVVLRICS